MYDQVAFEAGPEAGQSRMSGSELGLELPDPALGRHHLDRPVDTQIFRLTVSILSWLVRS
jgi:hypothetical protein